MREQLRDIAARVALPVGLGVVLGLIGPFGTFDLLPMLPRVLYWLAVIALVWLVADALIRQVDAVVGARLPARRIAVPLLGALIAAIPATGVVTLANGLSGIGWPSSLPTLAAQVLLLLAAIAVPVHALEDLLETARSGPTAPSGAGRGGSAAGPPHRAATSRSGDEAEAGTGLALFVARLSGPIEGQLLCLEMQDHYLVVHSSAGRELILCRMEDAARELAGLGRRVHRSWWVAETARTATERDGQRLFLCLADGRRVPVGRSYRAGLRAAGWV